MFKDNYAFSGFSVDDLDATEKFYGETLGMDVTKEPMGLLNLKIAKGGSVMVYPKGDAHQPATFTILNFPVTDVDKTVDELTAKGVEFIQYDTEDLKTDEKGIARGEQGPTIAWFKDPAGNILSILEERPE